MFVKLMDEEIADVPLLLYINSSYVLKQSLLRDRIVCGITNTNLRERLLRESELTLEKCLSVCRAAEVSKVNVKNLENPDSIHVVKQRYCRPKQSQNDPRSSNDNNKNQMKLHQKVCRYCGWKHEYGRDSCPAYGKECNYCKHANHFEKVCQKNLFIVLWHIDK